MTIDVDVVAVGGGMTRRPGFLSSLVSAIAAHEAMSRMLADRAIVDPVVLAAADVPLGSHGAVLAMRQSDPEDVA